jgi:uncharacterized delta-60 repeat protein
MPKFTLLLLGFFWVAYPAFSQQGALDLTFDPGSNTTNCFVNAIAIQSDQKMVIGSSTCFKRLNANGSLDASFNVGVGFNGWVETISIQSDSKLIVGGSFSMYKGDTAHDIVRLNIDGDIDSTFNAGAGTVGGSIESSALQNDGKIVLGGSFYSVNGTPCNGIARLNSDGSYDNSFQSGYPGMVFAVALQADGKIIIGGSFTSYNGVSIYRLARINSNGTLDATFNTGTGALGSVSVSCIAIQTDGKIVFGGSFTNFDGVTRNRIARVNQDGTLDLSFDPGLGANDRVETVAIQSSGKIVIGGAFTSYDGAQANRIVRLNTDGSLDTTFYTGSGANSKIYSSAIQSDDKIIIGGSFNLYDSIIRKYLARLNSNKITPDSFSTTAYCAGRSVSIPYIALGSYYSGNVFTAQLSNSVGNFSNPTVIGSISTQSSDTIKAYLPANTPTGSGYRIRVISSSPSVVGIDNGSDIAVTQNPNAPICLVTVDSSSTHNVLIWEKPTATTFIDSFYIYKETSSNVYSKIASIPFDSLSEYHDTSAVPDVSSYRYKLSAHYQCGGESVQSNFHNTIHLQYIGLGNFVWNRYAIQNQVNDTVNTYNVYRDDLNNGNFSLIGNKSALDSVFFDATAGTFPDASYVLDVTWSVSCTPSRAVTTSRSNIKHIKNIDILGFWQQERSNSFTIYPNPSQTQVTLASTPADISLTAIEIWSSIGGLVYNEKLNEGTMQRTLNTEHFARGVYTVGMQTSQGKIYKRMILK